MSIATIPAQGIDDGARLIDFARACKAAARAVTLYPGEHPAMLATLGRLVQLTAPPLLTVPLRITVLGEALTVGHEVPPRTDPAVAELASSLHSHGIGELTIYPEVEADAWRRFLLLIGRRPVDVRAEGGVATLWSSDGNRHLDVREIDYAEMLRERPDPTSDVSDLISYCLHDSAMPDDMRVRLLDVILGDATALVALMETLEAAGIADGRASRARASALGRLLHWMVATLAAERPEALELVTNNLATALGRLSPDVLLTLFDHLHAGDRPSLMETLIGRVPEHTVAAFVARHAITEGPTDRVAQAFQALVPDDRRERLLGLAQDVLSPAQDAAGLDQWWAEMAHTLLTSYTDDPYVSGPYGQELSRARTTAMDLEQLHDDSPERLAEWIGSVSASAVRQWDLALVADLLRVEQDSERWATLMTPVVALIEDLLFVGDFEPANELVQTLVRERHRGGVNRAAAEHAIQTLVGGPFVRHLVGHLAVIDDAVFDHIKALVLALGNAVITPLAEVLSEGMTGRGHERLCVLFLAFGMNGRAEIQRLRSSPNPAVRRTAVALLREFGGRGALLELTALLADPEPGVRRATMDALLALGTEAAFDVVAQALRTGTAIQRASLMHALSSGRDEHVAPALVYLVDHLDHRGRVADTYIRALHALGHLKRGGGIAALSRALRRGEWWAPRRTASLRNAAAAALARIGTREAMGVLEDAAANGTRGMGTAARTHLVASADRRDGP